MGGGILLALLGLVALLDPRAAPADPPPSAPVALAASVAAAPAALVPVAQAAARSTGADPAVLLAIARVECNYGRCQADQPDGLVPADLRSQVDARALQAGGATAVLLGLPTGRRIGDWVDPLAVAGGQHAMGFMQFLPSTWREETRAAPGHPRDPYSPHDSMLVAGSYLARLQNGEEDGTRRSLRAALDVYGGGIGYADQVVALTSPGQ